MQLEEEDDNKMPLKDRTCHDEEADLNITADTRAEQRRESLLKWMKRLTIGLIIFIGVFLIGYMLWKLTFSNANEPKLVEDVQTGSAETFNNIVPIGDAIIIPVTTTLEPLETDRDDRIITEEEKEELIATTLPPAKITSTLGIYEKAAVCTDSDICSKVGSDIFQRGGNVVDSALAVLLCNGITTMQSMGIGGGFIMNVYIKNENRAYTIDAREVAPFGATEDMFVNDPKSSLFGPLATAVPGEVMGYHKAHTRFGSLTWKEIIEPSIKICEEGFVLTNHQSKTLRIQKLLKNDTHLSSMFVNNETGEFHPVGTKIQPTRELCQTYIKLSENGPLDFYNGSLARDIAQDLADMGSIITADDLEAFNADTVSSISLPLGKNTLHLVPPVGSGTIVGNILSILNGYNFTKESIANETIAAQTFHRITEAFKFGFAKRWELGDQRFNDLRELVSQLTSVDFGDELRIKINDSATVDDISYYGARFSGSDDFGTSHVSILAPNGDAVSVTSSINSYYGSGLSGKRTGIIFNSGMDDFSTPGVSNLFNLPPSPTNFIEPQKRAMSSMSPTIVTNSTGHVVLVIGSAGGSKIITSVAQVIIRTLWFDEDIKTAIDAPRIHHQLVPGYLEYENESLDDIMELLKARGHKLKRFTDAGSVACGIRRNNTAIYANADIRKGGDVRGF